MTSELLKHLNEQLGTFLNLSSKNEVSSKRKKGIFKRNFFVKCDNDFIKYLCYLSFWKFFTLSFNLVRSCITNKLFEITEEFKEFKCAQNVQVEISKHDKFFKEIIFVDHGLIYIKQNLTI